MANIDDLRRAEDERELNERESRRRWEIADQRRTDHDILHKDFGDDLLEEAKERARQKGIS